MVQFVDILRCLYRGYLDYKRDRDDIYATKVEVS